VFVDTSEIDKIKKTLTYNEISPFHVNYVLAPVHLYQIETLRAAGHADLTPPDSTRQQKLKRKEGGFAQNFLPNSYLNLLSKKT